MTYKLLPARRLFPLQLKDFKWFKEMIFQGSPDEPKYPDSLGQSQQWQCMKKKKIEQNSHLFLVFLLLIWNR